MDCSGLFLDLKVRVHPIGSAREYLVGAACPPCRECWFDRRTGEDVDMSSDDREESRLGGAGDHVWVAELLTNALKSQPGDQSS